MIKIQTDGSYRCDDRQQYSAIGFCVQKQGQTTKNVASYLGKDQLLNSHFAEIASITAALEWVRQHYPAQEVRIENDSGYAVHQVKNGNVTSPYQLIVRAAHELSNRLSVHLKAINRSNNQAHDIAYPDLLHPEKLWRYYDGRGWIRQFLPTVFEEREPAFTLSEYRKAGPEKRRSFHNLHPRLGAARRVQLQAHKNGVNLDLTDYQHMIKRIRHGGSRWGIASGRSLDSAQKFCIFYDEDRTRYVAGIYDRRTMLVSDILDAKANFHELQDSSSLLEEYTPSSLVTRRVDQYSACGGDNWLEWLRFRCEEARAYLNSLTLPRWKGASVRSIFG